MASRLGSTSDTTQQHNAKHRAEVISASLQRLYSIDEEIAAIIEGSDIPGLREEKSAIKKKLRTDFQMPSALVSARYYGYRVERKALESGDDVTMDAIREMYRILPVGGTVDLVAVAEDKPQPESKGGKKGRKAVPKAELLPKAAGGIGEDKSDEDETEVDRVEVQPGERTEAYRDGYDAGRLGNTSTFNPFTGNARQEWLEGWKQARRETLSETTHQ